MGCQSDRVHDLADVLQGVRLAVGMLTDPGDAIAFHLPAYHPFLHTLRDMDRRLVPAPFDLDELAEVLRRERPRAMILCHPQNPTGHVFDRAELERLGALAIEHDLIIISDEIHSDLVYAPNTHIPFASISAAVEARTITVTSAWKAFKLAGLSWGVMHVGVESFDADLRSYPDHWFGGANLCAVEAALGAWTEGDAWLAAVMDVLDDFVGSVSGDITVVTTIVPPLQAAAEAAVVDELNGKGKKFGVEQGAFVAMRPDGAIRALVGGRNYADSQFNRWRRHIQRRICYRCRSAHTCRHCCRS